MQRIALIGAADGAVALSMPEAPGGVKARCLQSLIVSLGNAWLFQVKRESVSTLLI